MKRLAIIVLLIAGACASAPPQTDEGQDAGPAIAAAFPDTDIYLAPLTRTGDGWSVGKTRNLTARPGYDNQPAFDASGDQMLFASIRDGTQADVYRIDLGSGAITQVTATPESEYSPTPLPGGGFSSVRVEVDGTQRLWRFDDGGRAIKSICADITGVGYHAWLDDDLVALFVVDEPLRLLMTDTNSCDAPWPIAENIGRGLQRVPGRNKLSYVFKPADGPAEIRLFKPGGRVDTRLTQVVADKEDFVWLPDGTILMASGPRLYRWGADDESGWRDFAELAVDGAISRLAVSPDATQLAVVVTRNAP